MWDSSVNESPDVTVEPTSLSAKAALTDGGDARALMPLEDLSDQSVDLTQRWVVPPSVGPLVQVRSWVQEHKTLLTAMVAAGFVGLVAVLGVTVTLRTKDGDLIVEVDQPGAKVEVLDAEGTVLATGASGESPLTFSMEPGKHRMKVEKDGFVVHSEDVEITVRGKTMVRAKLVPEPPDQGTLVLTVSEADALVQLLGEAGNVEATYRSSGIPLSVPLAAGKHRLVIEKSGFQSHTTDLPMLTGAEYRHHSNTREDGVHHRHTGGQSQRNGDARGVAGYELHGCGDLPRPGHRLDHSQFSVAGSRAGEQGRVRDSIQGLCAAGRR